MEGSQLSIVRDPAWRPTLGPEQHDVPDGRPAVVRLRGEEDAAGAGRLDDGILARSRVPRPAGLSSESVPSSAASRSSSPRRPEPRATSAPPTPSSATSTVRCAVGAARRSPRRASPARTSRRWRAPRRRRSRPRSRPGRAAASSRRLDRHRHRRARDQRLQRRLEPALGQHRRVDAARELAQLGEARAQLLLRAVEQRRELLVVLHAPARASAAAARARRAATARRRGGRARAAGARRRRPRRAARATRAAPPCARRSSWSRCETWLRSRPPRNANGISAVAMNAAQNATSPAPARATVTSRKVSSEQT